MTTTKTSDALAQAPSNKQQQVYALIRNAIVTSEFPPGTVMVERKLCDIYNVSRSPIRNALQQLTFEGLLTYMPGKGTVVPDFTLEDILEVYDLLEVFQIYAIHQCILQLDDVAIETLRMILASMEEALASGDLYATSVWDQRFHDFLVNRSNNHRLKALFEQLNNQRVRFLNPTLNDHEHHRSSLSEHKQIVEYIIARDTHSAEEAIRQHYATLKQYFISLLIKKNFFK